MTPEVWLSAISALSGLSGVALGGTITFFTERWHKSTDRAEKRRALAASLAAEIEAYLLISKRRKHEQQARELIDRLRSGEPTSLRGWASARDEPLAEFPVFRSSMAESGLLGSVCSDLGKFYTLIAAVKTTLIWAENGRYEHLAPNQRADLVEDELAVWLDAIECSKALAARLKRIADGEH